MKIFIPFCIIIFTYGFLGNSISNANPLPYEAIFNFGDSISDTGNAAASIQDHILPRNSPYALGRLSNGRLIIDFIAEAYGLPKLPAYLNLTEGQEIRHGVNFAFAGASALDTDYFIAKGMQILPPKNTSLGFQLDWFKKLKPSLCKSKEECHEYFKNSLFVLGEIGGNDINTFIISKKDITELHELVSPVVEAITSAVTTLIEEGATQLVVPGNFPIGCNSGVMTVVNNANKQDYDQFGCLTAYNDFIENYNGQIKQAVETLKQKNPQVNITYFDYYGAAKRLFEAPEQYGFAFSENETFKACCGTGGPYNVNIYLPCGTFASTVCPDPTKRINWDGAHFTEAAYKLIAKGLVEGSFADPPLKPPLFNIA